jgi:hypothetical protein
MKPTGAPRHRRYALGVFGTTLPETIDVFRSSFRCKEHDCPVNGCAGVLMNIARGGIVVRRGAYFVHRRWRSQKSDF